MEFNSICKKYTENRFHEGFNNILIVCEKKDPDNNRLLESSDDFDKFNIIPKDTLGLSCLHDDYSA